MLLQAAIWLHLLVIQSLASSTERLIPRSNVVSLPIKRIQARDFDNNPNTTAGLVRVSIASDRQSYFTVIKVGDIHFRVALDTASADLWIVSSDCTTPQCEKVPRFPLAYQSPTFVELDGNKTTFDVRYVDGTTASGFLAKETIQLPGLRTAGQIFGLASTSNVGFTDQTSGLLGLGFPKLSSFHNNITNGAPFFPTLAQQGLLEYPLFAFSLTRNDTGSLTIGAIDASIVTQPGNISWHQVASFSPFSGETNATKPSYLQWAIPLTRFTVNVTDIQPRPTYPDRNGGRSLALIDVGASGIYGPIQDVTKLFSSIEGARIVYSGNEGQWAVPCNIDIPLSFTFGSRRFALYPEDYLIGPASGNPNLCLTWPRALPPHSDGIDWQFGTPFLRTIYSIYSYGINSKEPPMIGFYSVQNEALRNLTAGGSIASFFAANSATVPTTLPNFLLPTPTYSTPPYAFNATISAPIGAIVNANLATSTYSAIFGTHTTYNVSAIPTIVPGQLFVTQTLTDTDGKLVVSITTEPEAPTTLGVPPGWTPPESGGKSIWTSYSHFPTTILTLALMYLLL